MRKWTVGLAVNWEAGQSSAVRDGERFQNPWPHADHGVLDILRWKLMPWRVRDVPKFGHLDQPAGWQEADLSEPMAGVAKVTWLGHASFLIQAGGRAILVDPVFADFCAPLPVPSLRRCVPVPCRVADLPRVDAVLLTHSHYDHLDLATLRELAVECRLLVPRGHGEWLRARGFGKVTEVGWYESAEPVDGVVVTATPAQHFTARGPFDRNRGHWCGWLVDVGGVRLWHAGDSGDCPAFREIGARHGPVDFGMIPIGAYSPRAVMRAMHMNPAEAVRAFVEVGCRFGVGMHWGTFRLTDEPMGEPAAWLREECKKAGLGEDRFVTGRVGESWDVLPVT